LETITERTTVMRRPIILMCGGGFLLLGCLAFARADTTSVDAARLVGQPVDIAPSAYRYSAELSPDQNPPESSILLIQHANLPFEVPFGVECGSTARSRWLTRRGEMASSS
jgi:hypothetical protein